MITIKEVKIQFKSAFRKMMKEGVSQESKESAIPAYAHKNPLIDFLFWGRIKSSFGLIKRGSGNVLDFGCGTGVFSFLLAHKGYSVTAIDVNLNPKRQSEKYIHFPQSIRFLEGDLLESNFQNSYFDYIIALDSLEHIEHIENYLKLFKKLLKPDGVIIVSGPTENFFYRIGRALAGKSFNGEFHVSNIIKIRKQFSHEFKVKTVIKLYYPFVFFQIFTASNN